MSRIEHVNSNLLDRQRTPPNRNQRPTSRNQESGRTLGNSQRQATPTRSNYDDDRYEDVFEETNEEGTSFNVPLPTIASTASQWRPKELEHSITKSIATLGIPEKSANRDKWDNFLQGLHQHWSANGWPNDGATAKVVAAAIKQRHTPGQTLQALLEDLNLALASDNPLAIVGDALAAFHLDTESDLSPQLVRYMQLLRQKHNNPNMGYTDRRAIKGFREKIRNSPFSRPWDQAMLLYSDYASANDLAKVVKQCQAQRDYPQINKPVYRPKPVPAMRLDTKGQEFREAKESMEQEKCEVHPSSRDHTTMACDTMKKFHGRHPGMFRDKNTWANEKQNVLCHVHGFCNHTSANCYVVIKLRTDPEHVVANYRKQRGREEGSPNSENGTPPGQPKKRFHKKAYMNRMKAAEKLLNEEQLNSLPSKD